MSYPILMTNYGEQSNLTRYNVFNHFIQENKVIDLGFTGTPFTCNNKREKHAAVFLFFYFFCRD